MFTIDPEEGLVTFTERVLAAAAENVIDLGRESPATDLNDGLFLCDPFGASQGPDLFLKARKFSRQAPDAYLLHIVVRHGLERLQQLACVFEPLR